MRKYIILGTFFDMGGGQLYTRNKVDYLKKNGWSVELYTGRNGTLMIPELKEYEKNYIPELNYLPFYSHKKKCKKIIDEIASSTVDYDEVIIETSKQPMAIWGEMVAKKIKAKHIFFDLDEDFPVFDKWYYNFLDFKHKRKELAGIIPESLQKMFKDYKILADGENYNLKFPCGNQISSLNNGCLDGVQKGDFCFGCISRLDKDYIIPMVNELVVFARAHETSNISFILVGAAKDASIMKKVKSIIDDVSNLILYSLGYLSPIPQKMIDIVDFFIGTSGAACMTAEMGKITVAVDTITCKPIGIVGYNTDGAIFSKNDSYVGTLSDYLHYLCFQMDKRVIEEKLAYFNKNDYMVEFNNHMEFIKNSSPDIVYFDFKNIDWKNRYKYRCIRILGIKISRNVKRVISKMHQFTHDSLGF